MDGKGHYTDLDYLGMERLWRTVKYVEVYLMAYSNGGEAKAALDDYFRFYNTQRPHQSLGYRTPAEVFNGDSVSSDEQSTEKIWSPDRTMISYPGATGPSLNLAPILSN